MQWESHLLGSDHLEGRDGDNGIILKLALKKYVVCELVQELANCPDEVFATSELRYNFYASHKPP
jgi:hypothetical protein